MPKRLAQSQTPDLEGTGYQTAADQAYTVLKRRILAGDLPPGMRIDQDAEARRLTLSRMPIREALRRLESEGLVDVLRHRGALVRPLSADDLEDVYVLRVALEGIAGRLGAERIGDEDLSAMRELVRKATELAAGGELPAWLEADGAFHDVLFAAAGRARLLAQIQALREEAGRYRVLRLAQPWEQRLGVQHHRDILAACERRNASRVERLIIRALERSREVSRRILLARTTPPEAQLEFVGSVRS